MLQPAKRPQCKLLHAVQPLQRPESESFQPNRSLGPELHSEFIFLVGSFDSDTIILAHLRRAVRISDAVLVVGGRERHVRAGVDGRDVAGISHGNVEEIR